MNKKELLKKIETVERIAAASKIKRMLNNPFKYVNSILFRELIYKRTKKEKHVVCNTFYDYKIHLLLPSSTDIYLTGGKSHDSEIRLAKFLIQQLNKGDTFIDVGAHYGYFTLLASKLIGESGLIYSFEASPTTFKILEKNKALYENIVTYNLAASDENSHLIFYEFPNLYSEYNSLDIEQFKHEEWFSKYRPKEIKIGSIQLSDFLLEEDLNPKIIKIDVEGAEFKVINGLQKYLLKKYSVIVMEFLSDNRGNLAHIKAKEMLESFGYKSYIIESSGELKEVHSISDYLDIRDLESDNIVFKNK